MDLTKSKFSQKFTATKSDSDPVSDRFIFFSIIEIIWVGYGDMERYGALCQAYKML